MMLMPSTLFEQQRFITAQIRSNYFTILHENEDLRKLVTQLQKENDELKRNIEKTSQAISSNDA